MNEKLPSRLSQHGLGQSSKFEVAKLDSEKMRSSVAAKLFGGSAAPVRIGPYTVLSRLGAGGMGVVYSAYDERLDRKIAVKVLHGRAQLTIQEERIAREAKALAKVSHPHVVQVYEVGSFRGQVYLAMEYLPGQTLRKSKYDPKLGLREGLAPWIQAGKGLCAAHAAGLVHRDFKPENAMQLPDGGPVKVFDFGLATRLEDAQDQDKGLPAQSLTTTITQQDLHSDQSRRTMSLSGATVGTPAYMAPEQHLGHKADPRSDQFSYCVSIWEFLNQKLPYGGSTSQELVNAMKAGQLRRCTGPSWLTRILSRGLSYDPQDRYPSMQALIQALEQGFARKRRVLWAGAAILPVAIASSFALGNASAPDPCLNLTTHWDRNKDLLAIQPSEHQISNNPRGVAKATFARVVQDLRAYVERGRSQHIRACQSAMEAQKAGDLGFAAQSSCYVAAADAVSAFAKRLAAAKKEQLRPALWLSSSLPSLSACDELAKTPNEIVDASTRDGLEQTLARAQVEIAFNSYEPAQKLAKDVLAQSEKPGLERLSARALLVLARAEQGIGKLSKARKSVDKAYRIAEKIADPGLRLNAALARAQLFLKQGDVAAFNSQLRDAYPLAQRSNIDPESRVKYFGLACHAARGDFDICEAHRNCVEGLEIIDNKPGSTPARNRLYRNLAWLYLEAGLLQRGIDTADRSRDELQAVVGASSVLMLPSQALRLTILGEQVRQEGKDKAKIEALLPMARALHDRFVKVYGEDARKVIPVRTNLAELLRWSNHLQEAKPLFVSLLEKHPKDPGRYFTLVAYGQLQIAMGDKEAGIQTLKEGLSIIEAMQTRSENSKGATRIPEQGEALFAIAQALGPTPEGLHAAREAKKAYASIHALAQRTQERQACPALSQGKDPYLNESKAIQAWLDAHDKAG